MATQIAASSAVAANSTGPATVMTTFGSITIRSAMIVRPSRPVTLPMMRTVLPGALIVSVSPDPAPPVIEVIDVTACV